MNTALGTFELVISWSDGRRERLPLALLREAFTSLPEERGDLRGRLAAWTRERADSDREVSPEELAAMENELLEVVHKETSDFGLLNHLVGNGQLVQLDGLPDDSRGVRSVFVFALAIRRFRLLQHAVGTEVKAVDIDDAVKEGT
jgi:hypothetical protein